MHCIRFFVAAIVITFAFLLIQSCGKSDSNSGSGTPSASGSGITGTYAAVDQEEMTMEFKSDGTVVMAAKGIGSSNGTYVTDGEKIVVSIDSQKHTFIRDGNCIEEARNIFGKLCKGGKAGEASNVSTRNVPTTPTGIWVATNEDGEFKIEFKPDNKLTLHMTPTVGKPASLEGKFEIEGDTYYATLEPGTSMVLKFVNDTYESTSFGLPMKFVRQ